jgi:protoheme IX farnesyltransferase
MDAMAWVLFGILFFWQLPHFLALSWMYRSDYTDGGFVMHATSDDTGSRVGLLTVATSLLTAVSAVLPTIMGVTGWLYGGGVLVLGLWLTWESVRMYQQRDHASARRVLVTSYAVLMGIVALMLVDKMP